jgi:hypothetical protein
MQGFRLARLVVLHLAVALSVGLAACEHAVVPTEETSPPLLSASVFKDHRFVSEDIVGATNNCTGETLQFDMFTAVTLVQVLSPSGGSLFHDNVVWNGTATAADGTPYHFRAAQPFTEHFSGATDAHTETFVYMARLIGPGPFNNSEAQGVAHVTMNASGEVTSYHPGPISFTCR